MGTIELVLAMMAAVVISGVLVHVLPFGVPTPLVQIGMGAFIAIFTDDAVRLDPEIFFLLFLPPLLFLDGWRIPKEGLLRDRRMILALALGLVFFTVIGMGYFIHWMIPAMPMRWPLHWQPSCRPPIRWRCRRSPSALRCQHACNTCSKVSRC